MSLPVNAITRTLAQSGATAFVAALLFGCSRTPACAQARSAKVAPASPSTGLRTEHAATNVVPIAQQYLAEAVLADVLSRIYNQADEHFHNGEYFHAINLDRVVVEGDPKNVEAYCDGAYLLWSTGRGDECVTVLKQGLTANSDNYYMYDELGTHYFLHLHQPAAALPYYEKAVQYKCPFFTYHGLAHCYEKTGRWADAVKTWEKATALVDSDGSLRAIAEVNLKKARAALVKQRSGGH